MAFKGEKEALGAKTQAVVYCGKCEDGWHHGKDTEPGYVGVPIARVCTCNAKGQEVVAEERRKEHQRTRATDAVAMTPERGEEIRAKLAAIMAGPRKKGPIEESAESVFQGAK